MTDRLVLRVHPGLAASVLRCDTQQVKGERRQHAPGFYLWLLARAANEAGNGWLTLETLAAFCKARGMGRKKFQRYLEGAEEVGFVEVITRRDGETVVRVRSLEKVALTLGCESLGWPVEVEDGAKYTGSIGKWRATLLAAWHSARRKPNPISQATIARVTGVKARRQSAYSERAGVRRSRNYAESQIPARHLPGIRAAHPAAFAREGVIVFPLPNSYRAPFERAAHRGMARNVDRALALSAGVLLNRKPSSPSGEASCDLAYREVSESGASWGRAGRMYFDTRKGAAQAWQRSSDDDDLRFYRAQVVGRGKTARRVERFTRDGSRLWGVVGLPIWGSA